MNMAKHNILKIFPDALVSNRDGKGGNVQDRVLSVLLNEMDGIGVAISDESSRTKALEGDNKKIEMVRFE